MLLIFILSSPLKSSLLCYFQGYLSFFQRLFTAFFREFLEQEKVKLLSLSWPFPLFPQSLLDVSGYSCLLPIGTLCAGPISSRSHSQYCWHQPLTYHDLSKKKKKCRFHWFFFLLFAFLKLWESDFPFCFYSMQKNSLPSFKENFDFHTVLPPVRKDTANNIGTRFMINEEGHRAENPCYCPSGFNPLCQARENILAQHHLQPL